MRNDLHKYKSIEHRILFSLLIIGLVPLAISFIFNNIIISDSLLKLETKNIHALGNQTMKIIEEKLNEMGMVAREHSISNEAYEKLDIKDKEWFKENFSGCIPESFNYDLSIVINKDNEVIDEFGLKNNDVSQLLKIESIANIVKVPYEISEAEDSKGILMYDGEPYLFYASPIIKGYYMGEPIGELIIGKKISSKFIGEIEKRLGDKIFMTFGDKIIYSGEIHDNIDDYVEVSKVHQNISSIKFINNELVGSLSLGNVPNVGQAKLTVIMNRDIFMQTRKIQNISSMIIIGFSIISILVMGFLLKRKTMSPLKSFENQISRMSQNNVISYVEIDGPEEVERLTEEFNKMVNKLNEQSIENQNLRSELEFDRLNSEFLANVSHEFKTPLNVILGTIQLIELFSKKEPKDIMSKDMSRHVHVMKQNCYRLLRLVNNLIDLTKIRSNAYKIHLKNYNIINLIEDITLSVAEYTESQGVFVGFDTNTEEKVMACDPDQIERIILNLLSNSIKFTKPGGEIWVSIQDKEDSLLITIKDNGVGIPEDQLEVIFERFRQVDRSLTRNHEGSGIGLSLVKSLVEMHKGTIQVKSEYGKGSEFIIELPVEILSETAEVNEKNKIVEQNKVARINIEFSDIYSG
jgi:signal transduction histidine kinase